MANMLAIEALLAEVEGPRSTQGYVPCQPRNFTGQGKLGDYAVIGQSGVTIATGCDLGQTDAAELAAYGLEAFIIAKLTPYLGRKRFEALRMLQMRPLTLQAQEAQALDLAVHNGYLNRYVRPAYQKKSQICFDDLPSQAQAVIFSVCFQKGCGGVARQWPKLWGYLTSQDWSGAAHELRHGFRTYRNRRAAEGRLLAELL